MAAERVRLLEQAVRRITQRVNLFEKILIPTAKENIKKIQIYLADAERAAVVRSKLTKKMRQQQAACGVNFFYALHLKYVKNHSRLQVVELI